MRRYQNHPRTAIRITPAADPIPIPADAPGLSDVDVDCDGEEVFDGSDVEDAVVEGEGSVLVAEALRSLDVGVYTGLYEYSVQDKVTW